MSPDRMRVALSGSACTGKTTLATALGERLGLPVIPEETRARLEAGLPGLGQLPAAEGLAVLQDLWAARLELEDRLGAFVADNGPLDFAAYALHHGCVPDASHPFVQAVLARLDTVQTLLLPWGALPYEHDGVRCADPGTERRFQDLLEGLIPEAIALHRLPAAVTAHPDRVAWAVNVALGRD